MRIITPLAAQIRPSKHCYYTSEIHSIAMQNSYNYRYFEQKFVKKAKKQKNDSQSRQKLTVQSGKMRIDKRENIPFPKKEDVLLQKSIKQNLFCAAASGFHRAHIVCDWLYTVSAVLRDELDDS